jgi:oxygen-dependent protoporphyrinogen oxidase
MRNNTIVIAGAGLTGLSTAYFLRRAGRQVVVLEKGTRPGGVIRSETDQGFLYEAGPNTGVLGSAEAVQLFAELSGSCELLAARKEASKRYILKNSVWRALPSGLLSGITTPLFSISDKLRILGEPFRSRGADPDESVASMVRRRLGKSYLDYAVDPFISGIYAGDPETLITRYALPKLWVLEQNYGSFIRGALAKAREPKSMLEKKVSREVFSFRGGMEKIIEALVDFIGRENIITEATQVSAVRRGRTYEISYTGPAANKATLISEALILTTGAADIQSILSYIPEKLLQPVSRLRYAPVVQVAAGFRSWNGMKLDGFGGLIPGSEKRDILGVLFPSSIFEGRAPEGGALLSIFLGGIRKPCILDLEDSRITDLVIRETEKLFQQNGAPDMLKIMRYSKAIPQYEADSGDRLKAISAIEKENEGLVIAGNVRDGIGISDRIKQAATIAEKLIRDGQ